ncbi:MAG: exodeoxyribonuclease VII large subunit [Pseudomonadales bacterium]
MLAQSATRPVLSVSALAREARLLIEDRFHLVWVEGEISNLRRPSSGHWYFTLKDDAAQLRCAMFAGRNRALRFSPRDGAQVMIRGRVSLYEARGDFQIVADHMEPAGEGALRAAFEALQRRLEAEGLFAAERKRRLPLLPQRLAVISSPTGAALRDVLQVIARRFPALEVVLLPVAVQGERAEGEILAALARIADLRPDVVLITRGGGSLEDLWAFNLERVARAVAACPVPIVSAVGHETDITIADLIADVRAPTPSAGAELITPDRRDIETYLSQAHARLQRALLGELLNQQRHLRHLRARLVDPRKRLQQQMQRADELEERLRRALTRRLQSCGSHLGGLARGLYLVRPSQHIAHQRDRLRDLTGALAAAGLRAVGDRDNRLAAAARTLQAVSPLATLARGYAVISGPAQPDGASAVTSIRRARPGDRLTAHLQDGALEVQVTAVDEDNRLPQLPNN